MPDTIDIDPPERPRGPQRPSAHRPRQGPQIPKKGFAYAAAAMVGLVALSVIAKSGRIGFVYVDDSEVAVVQNYLSGSREVITQPGYKFYIPFIAEAFRFDRTPQKFLMKGEKYIDENHVPELKVRAKDGSNFRFETLEIQYSLIPGTADIVLDDSGAGDSYKTNWVMAHARSVLRDEFGRFSAEEAADPTKYELARTASKDRLNVYLDPHGIRILNIVIPKPRFDPAYEEAIEQRKVADQEVERLEAKKNQLKFERGQALARVDKDKKIEFQTLTGTLNRDRELANRDAVTYIGGAKAYANSRIPEGEGYRDAKLIDAEALVSKYTKEAEGLKAQTMALAERGEVVVREALIERLKRIKFNLVPYSRDSEPKRLEHVDARGATDKLLDEQSRGGQ